MTAEPEVWTTMRLLQTSARYLAEKGSPSGRLDAELLLAHVLKTERIRLYVDFDKPVTDAERAAYRELVRRRAAGEPVAYLIGEKEFYGRVFRTDRRALIPRPETELLIDAVLRLRPDRDAAWTAADLGTGSGAIAVTLAAEYPQATVHAVEVDEAALALARENAEAHGVSERIRFHSGSWVEPLAGLTFDFVVANPPYIADGDPRVEPGVKEYEPHVALYAGPTGLEAITVLADGLPTLLRDGGFWACEFGAGERDAIADLLAARGWAPAFENDLAGIPRLFVAHRRQ